MIFSKKPKKFDTYSFAKFLVKMLDRMYRFSSTNNPFISLIQMGLEFPEDLKLPETLKNKIRYDEFTNGSLGWVESAVAMFQIKLILDEVALKHGKELVEKVRGYIIDNSKNGIRWYQLEAVERGFQDHQNWSEKDIEKIKEGLSQFEFLNPDPLSNAVTWQLQHLIPEINLIEPSLFMHLPNFFHFRIDSTKKFISNFLINNPISKEESSKIKNTKKYFRNTMSEIDVEIMRAEPISRKRMDLLWLDPEHLERLALNLGDKESIEASFGEEPIVRAHQVTREDLDWARGIEKIVYKAYTAGQSKKYEDAIIYYKQALKEAPGTDLFLMSIGVAYGKLYQLELAVKYLSKASFTDPTNKRIKSNLDELLSKHHFITIK